MPRPSEFKDRELPGWLNGLLVVTTLAALLWFEKKRPLRRMRQNKLVRDGRNLGIAALSAAAVSAVERPAVLPLARKVVRNRWGLLSALRLPAWLELVLTVVLLDYTLFIWHYLTHRVPLLWRFHQAHHADLDMDATTALRFHFGEMILSTPWRAGQVLLLGASTMGLSLWQTITLVEILFHHSNVRLPAGFERRLCRLIVTPRMHGIHHSIVQKETDSNWSTIFTFPDFLHGTLRLNVPQDAITIGVAGFQDPAELTLAGIIKLPVTADRQSWQLAGDGTPEREEFPPLPQTVLAD